MIVTNVLLEPQAFGALKTVNLCRENERKRTVSHYRSGGATRTCEPINAPPSSGRDQACHWDP